MFAELHFGETDDYEPALDALRAKGFELEFIDIEVDGAICVEARGDSEMRPDEFFDWLMKLFKHFGHIAQAGYADPNEQRPRKFVPVVTKDPASHTMIDNKGE